MPPVRWGFSGHGDAAVNRTGGGEGGIPALSVLSAPVGKPTVQAEGNVWLSYSGDELPVTWQTYTLPPHGGVREEPVFTEASLPGTRQSQCVSTRFAPGSRGGELRYGPCFPSGLSATSSPNCTDEGTAGSQQSSLRHTLPGSRHEPDPFTRWWSHPPSLCSSAGRPCPPSSLPTSIPPALWFSGAISLLRKDCPAHYGCDPVLISSTRHLTPPGTQVSPSSYFPSSLSFRPGVGCHSLDFILSVLSLVL